MNETNQGHLQQQHKSMALQGFDLNWEPWGLVDWGPFWGGPSAPLGVPAPSIACLELGDVAKVDTEFTSGPDCSLYRGGWLLGPLDVLTILSDVGPIVALPMVETLWTVADVELTRSVILQDIYKQNIKGCI